MNRTLLALLALTACGNPVANRFDDLQAAYAGSEDVLCACPDYLDAIGWTEEQCFTVHAPLEDDAFTCYVEALDTDRETALDVLDCTLAAREALNVCLEGSCEEIGPCVTAYNETAALCPRYSASINGALADCDR